MSHKEEMLMGKKGNETKLLIKERASNLFAKKGYKEVTMKDICQETGLSRGGLYRHYSSTEQIFSEIIEGFLNVQNDIFKSEIEKGTSARDILNTILDKYKEEMIDTNGSLSMAIYEFFSSRNIPESENLLFKQYLASFNSWNTLIQYGIAKGEFREVDVRGIFDLIVFSYQGVRMYSQLMEIKSDIPERIVAQIKHLLLNNEGRFKNE